MQPEHIEPKSTDAEVAAGNFSLTFVDATSQPEDSRSTLSDVCQPLQQATVAIADYVNYSDDEEFAVIADDAQEYGEVEGAEERTVAPTENCQVEFGSKLCNAVSNCDLPTLSKLLSDPAYSITLEDIRGSLQIAVVKDWPLGTSLLLCFLADDLDCEFGLHLVQSAIAEQHFEAARVLICGDSLELSDGGVGRQLGETDLILAVQPGASVAFVRQFADLARQRGEINCADIHGRTALSYAAQRGLFSLVKLLVRESGANPGLRDYRGWSPLDYAMDSLSTENEVKIRWALSETIDMLIGYSPDCAVDETKTAKSIS